VFRAPDPDGPVGHLADGPAGRVHGRRLHLSEGVSERVRGVVRAGLDPDDVILALAGLWEIDPATDWKARARILYDLVFTGLKA